MELSLLADKPEESKIIAQWYYDEWLSNVHDVTLELVRGKVSRAINRDQIPLTVLAHKDQKLVGVVELEFHENKNHSEYEHWLGGM